MSKAYSSGRRCAIWASQRVTSLYRLLRETRPGPISFENMSFDLAFVFRVLVTNLSAHGFECAHAGQPLLIILHKAHVSGFVQLELVGTS